jgi:predicted dehydrogenase
MWALKYKKPVCVQKPLCNTIWEVRELHKAARNAGVLTQMGNQGRTLEGHRLAKEWVDRGLIGTLKEVRLWTNRPIWPQGPLKKITVPCPENLDWDLWLSTEPSEPYFEFEGPKVEVEQAKKKGRKRGNGVHPFNWRGWWQFGSGALGDMGCHIMDATFSVLGQRIPEKIEVSSSPISALNAPSWSRLVYHFAASDKFPKLTVSWQDGIKDGKPNLPERDERIPEDEFKLQTSGMMFIGTEGVILADTYCNRPVLYPEERDIEVRTAINNGTYEKKERRSTHPGNPQMEWANAIVNGGVTSSNFDYAAPLTEFVLLGNLAIRAGETIRWDAKKMAVSNTSKPNRFVKRPSYRSGWV